MISILVLVLLLPAASPPLYGFSIASVPQATWAKTYGGSALDVFHSVRQTFDGGFVAAGSTGSFGGGGSWVVRLDPNGDVVWQNVYGGGGCFGSYSARQTSDGGFIVSVETSSFPSNNTCVVRLDADGNVQWQKAYNGAGDDETFALEETSDGGFILAGETNYRGGQAPDAFLLRLDRDGNVLWQKTYGGTGWDVFGSVSQTRDGGFVAAGASESFGAGGFDGWMMKLDSVGNIEWQEAIGGLGRDALGPIIETASGGFVAAGDTTSFGTGPYDFDIWVVSVAPSGSLGWQKAYNVGIELGLSLVQTDDAGMVVGGLVQGDAALLKLDQTGNVVWLKTYGGSSDDSLSAVQQTNDGGFVGAGHTKSFGVHGDVGSGDAWVLRLDAQGNLRGQCHQKGPSKVAKANSLAQVTTTTVTGIDVVTIPIAVTSTVTSTAAVVGVQCLVSRRP